MADEMVVSSLQLINKFAGGVRYLWWRDLRLVELLLSRGIDPRVGT